MGKTRLTIRINLLQWELLPFWSKYPEPLENEMNYHLYFLCFNFHLKLYKRYL